jgi:hypothetical protein
MLRRQACRNRAGDWERTTLGTGILPASISPEEGLLRSGRN